MGILWIYYAYIETVYRKNTIRMAPDQILQAHATFEITTMHVFSPFLKIWFLDHHKAPSGWCLNVEIIVIHCTAQSAELNRNNNCFRHSLLRKKNIIQQLKVFLSSRTYSLWNYIIRTVWTANDAVFQDMMPQHHFYMF